MAMNSIGNPLLADGFQDDGDDPARLWVVDNVTGVFELAPPCVTAMNVDGPVTHGQMLRPEKLAVELSVNVNVGKLPPRPNCTGPLRPWGAVVTNSTSCALTPVIFVSDPHAHRFERIVTGALTRCVAATVPANPRITVRAPVLVFVRARTYICSESISMMTPEKIGSVFALLIVIDVETVSMIAALRLEEHVHVEPCCVPTNAW